MTDHQTIERQTITDDGSVRRDEIETRGVPGDPGDGDEQVGGAAVGGIGGAVVGGIVGGPVGAVVGGAIGAAAGATAGLIDEADEDDEIVSERRVVEQREERLG